MLHTYFGNAARYVTGIFTSLRSVPKPVSANFNCRVRAASI